MKIRVAALIFASMFCLTSVVSAQDIPITPENADQLAEIGRLSYGAITDIAYSPDGNTLAVETGLGVALYDANDFDAPPRFLEGKPNPYPPAEPSPKAVPLERYQDIDLSAGLCFDPTVWSHDGLYAAV